MAQDWRERQGWRNEERRRMDEGDHRRMGERDYGQERYASQEEGGRQFGRGWRGGGAEQDWAQREEFGRGREYGRGYDRDQDYGLGERYGPSESGSQSGSRSYRGRNERGGESGSFLEGRDYGEIYRQGRGQYGQPEAGRGYEQTYGRDRELGRSWTDEGRMQGAGSWQGRGAHSGRGPKGYARSDDRIKEDVCDRLTDDPELDASNIEVMVSSCEVTLDGTVDSREAKRRAEDCAENVSGVKNVQNNIRVQQTGTSGGDEDRNTGSTTASTAKNTKK